MGYLRLDQLSDYYFKKIHWDWEDLLLRMDKSLKGYVRNEIPDDCDEDYWEVFLSRYCELHYEKFGHCFLGYIWRDD